MGWGMIAAPGTEVGPCKEECKHTDCAVTRVMAESLCIHCNKPIGYEKKFYQITKPKGVESSRLLEFLSLNEVEEVQYAHAVCAWEKEEQRQKELKQHD